MPPWSLESLPQLGQRASRIIASLTASEAGRSFLLFIIKPPPVARGECFAPERAAQVALRLVRKASHDDDYPFIEELRKLLGIYGETGRRVAASWNEYFHAVAHTLGLRWKDCWFSRPPNAPSAHSVVVHGCPAGSEPCGSTSDRHCEAKSLRKRTSRVSAREDVLKLLARASVQGRLGLLVGTGFSIALTKGADTRAPNWEELLAGACRELGLEMPPSESVYGKSFPRIASQLIDQLAEREDADVSEEEAALRAVWKFKSSIAKLCHLVVENDHQRRKWTSLLQAVDPAWVVTTNYDLLIEEVIPNSSALLPRDLMPVPRGGPIPVFHLHGHRLDPHSLVIREEDYTALFHPGDYRQRKLSLLLAESVVLVLGYALGDINVLSALDLAATYGGPGHGGAKIVQALWRSDGLGTKKPRTGSHGEQILEITGIEQLLAEIADVRNEVSSSAEADAASVRSLLEDPEARQSFVDNVEEVSYWNALRNHAELAGNLEVLQALTIVLDELWSSARQPGNFEQYRQFLHIVLQGLCYFSSARAHPSIVALLTDRWLDVAQYIDPDNAQSRGTSWSASDLWAGVKTRLPLALIEDLRERARARGDYRLRRLLPVPGSPELPQFQQCPKCGAGSDKLEGTGVVGNEYGQYFEIRCRTCGWSEGGEI